MEETTETIKPCPTFPHSYPSFPRTATYPAGAVVVTLLVLSLLANLLMACKVWRCGVRGQQQQHEASEEDDSHVTSEGEESLQPAAVVRFIKPEALITAPDESSLLGRRRSFASFFDRRLSGAKETPAAIRSPPKRRFSFLSLSRVTSTPVKPPQPSRFEPALATHEEQSESVEMSDLVERAE